MFLTHPFSALKQRSLDVNLIMPIDRFDLAMTNFADKIFQVSESQSHSCIFQSIEIILSQSKTGLSIHHIPCVIDSGTLFDVSLHDIVQEKLIFLLVWLKLASFDKHGMITASLMSLK
jgi:hypothetical protein